MAQHPGRITGQRDLVPHAPPAQRIETENDEPPFGTKDAMNLAQNAMRRRAELQGQPRAQQHFRLSRV